MNKNLSVRLVACNIGFINSLITEKVGAKVGFPMGNWLQITGQPGTCKTTLALQLANSLASNSDTEAIHLDYELGPRKAIKLYGDIRATSIETYLHDPETPLDTIYHKASQLLEEDKNLVAVVDSTAYLFNKMNDYSEQRRVARYIRKKRNEHPNLLIITVTHQSKQGHMSGAAELYQLCDIALLLEKKYGFIYLTNLKNREQAPGAPDVIKLTVERPGRGLVVSTEPDFVSQIPLVQFFRSLKK